MLFGERVAFTENIFSKTDLLQYVETLIKEAKQTERLSARSHYSWLSSRDVHVQDICELLDELNPLVNKMTSESCVAIAVKLDQLPAISSTAAILATFRQLLQERDSIQMLEATIKSKKEIKHKKIKVNRVRPELSPPGRQATVSFIIEDNNQVM